MKPISGTGKPTLTSRNLLIIGDCFTKADKKLYEDACDDIVTAIESASWHPKTWNPSKNNRLYVWRADSYLEGKHRTKLSVDDGCAPLAEPVPYTRFATKYTADRGDLTCRYLEGETGKVADYQVSLKKNFPKLPAFDFVLVLVNYPKFGGVCRGTMAWSSKSADNFIPLVLHELGHTFGLYDEYEQDEGVADPVLTATETVSVVGHANLATNGGDPPWSNHADPKPLETAAKSSCSQREPDKASAMPHVGAYPGGGYFHCRFYRPSHTCGMRKVGDEFCKICRMWIANVLDPNKPNPIAQPPSPPHPL